MILVAFALFVLPIKQASSLELYEGWLSAYDQDPTMDTLYYRLDIGDVQLGHDVYIAVSDCKRIGETGTMTIGESGPLSYQVFDCLGDDIGHDWMTDRNIIAEIDYWAWKKYGLGRATITPSGEIELDQLPVELPEVNPEISTSVYLEQVLNVVQP